jgi:hypothetical protein
MEYVTIKMELVDTDARKQKKRRSPRALYSNKAPNWARGTINKCGRQFRNISRYNLTYEVFTEVAQGTEGTSRWRQYLAA